MPLKEQLMDSIRKNDNIKVSELLDKMDVSAVNEMTDQHGITALHAACEHKNDRALTLLLAKTGIDVNVKDRFGSTPLHMACGWPSNDQAISKLLAIPGIQVNVQNRYYGSTPLHMACGCRNDQAISKLLAIPGIQVNVQNRKGSTPLHMVRCGQSAVPLLATPGIDVNAKDNYGRTPVMVADGYGREEVFKLLLHDPRVDLDIKDNEGRGLEEAVGRMDGGKKYLNLIQEERMKRGNAQKKQDKASSEESTGIVIEKIEKINKKIEEGKKRLTDVLEKQKVERQEILEKQKLEKEEFLEKLARKHQEEKTEQEKIFTREAEASRQHMTDLTEMRNELARDLEKIHFDEGKINDAINNDEKLKAARRALECPICMESMKPPKKIWMCPRSHAVCEACKILLEGKPCPTCSSGRINQRAYTTEKMAKIVFDQSED